MLKFVHIFYLTVHVYLSFFPQYHSRRLSAHEMKNTCMFNWYGILIGNFSLQSKMTSTKMHIYIHWLILSYSNSKTLVWVGVYKNTGTLPQVMRTTWRNELSLDKESDTIMWTWVAQLFSLLVTWALNVAWHHEQFHIPGSIFYLLTRVRWKLISVQRRAQRLYRRIFAWLVQQCRPGQR